MTKNKLINKDERLDDLQLDGLMIIQNPKEYCFTSDAVALANFAKCKKGDVVVDLCSGSGVIGILVNAKCKPQTVHLVELQSHLADMCARTIEYNNINNITMHNRALQGVSSDIGLGKVDVVVCNPPYKCASNRLGDNERINIAKHELAVTLEEIISESSKLLKFGGKLYMVNKTERLTDMMCLMRQYKLEPKLIKILNQSKSNSVVMVEATKNGKSGIKIQIG